MASVLETIGPRSGAAPFEYTVTELGTVDVQSVYASFDGTAAAEFLPVVTVRSQSGAILARSFPGESVAAGGSADVTFGPFLRSAGGASGDAVQFNVAGQRGGYLDIFTDDNSINIEDNSGNGLSLYSSDPSQTTGGFVGIATADGTVSVISTEIINRIGAFGHFRVQDPSAADVVLVRADSYIQVDLDSSRSLNVQGGGATRLEVFGDGRVSMPFLPGAPGAPGELWNDGGTVKIA